MAAPVINLTITRGKTFQFGFLYADSELVYKPITAMPSTAPVRLTVEDHGIPDGWPVQVTCVRTPTELNTDEGAYRLARVIDVDTIEFNDLNANCLRAYTQSGLVVFNKPTDLTGWSARAQIRDREGGTLLFSWHSDPLQSPDAEIDVDVARSMFILNMSPTQSEALDWRKAVYDLEAISPAGDVFALTAISQVTVLGEVTTP